MTRPPPLSLPLSPFDILSNHLLILYLLNSLDFYTFYTMKFWQIVPFHTLFYTTTISASYHIHLKLRIHSSLVAIIFYMLLRYSFFPFHHLRVPLLSSRTHQPSLTHLLYYTFSTVVLHLPNCYPLLFTTQFFLCVYKLLDVNTTCVLQCFDDWLIIYTYYLLPRYYVCYLLTPWSPSLHSLPHSVS